MTAHSSDSAAESPVGSSARARSKTERLYLEHWTATVGFAYVLTGDRSIAEEVAQEGLVRALGRFKSLRNEDAFQSYLYRTVTNLVTTDRRRRARERKYVSERKAEDTVSQPDVETQDQIWTALLDLPERQKIALVLRYCEDMSEAQVADVMNTSPKAIKSLITRGLGALRDRREELK